MERQARRSGASAGRASAPGPASHDTQAVPTAELVEDRVSAIASPTIGSGRSLGLGRSIPSAIVGTFLVAGLAFGAALGPTDLLGSKGSSDGAGSGPVAEATSKATDAVHPKATEKVRPEATAKPVFEPTAKPVPDATSKPAPDATPKPEPKPDPKPEPEPEPKPDPDLDGVIGIWVALTDGYPVIEWAACEAGTFDYYKVVRSKDATVTWPAGDNDVVIGVVEPGGKRRAWDKHSPDDRKLWYRVFCVAKRDGGYRVVQASAAKGIEVPDRPDPTPPPDPIDLALEAAATAEGKVQLGWSACEVNGFAFYKLVRAAHDDPSYHPWTDGTTVVAAIGDAGATGWLDKPGGGQTVWYRIQCFGYHGDSKVLLGQSAAVAVTLP